MDYRRKNFGDLLKGLYGALIKLVRFLCKDFREMFSWATLRALLSFLWSLLKDVYPAYRVIYWKIFRQPAGYVDSPFTNKGGVLQTAGHNLYIANAIRGIVGGIIIGMLFGATFSLFIPLWPFYVLFFLFVPTLLYQMLNFRLGYMGECMVAEELEKFRLSGWKVLHSFSFNAENTSYHTGDIDHILISDRGVFCVETKALRVHHVIGGKKLSFHKGAIWTAKGKKLDRPDPVKQAKRNAMRLRKLLKDNISEITSSPIIRSIIVFPGWYVEEERQDDEVYVYVLNHERIGQLLEQQPEQVLPESVIGKIFAFLEKQNRYRYDVV